MAIGKILVGVDGSLASEAAMRWSIDLARSLGAELIVLHSLGLLSSLHHGEMIVTELHRGAIVEEFESEWCAPLLTSGVDYQTIVADGNPVSAILDVAARLDADIIVLGSRGHNILAPLLGSTSHQVAQRSTRAVVIIPPATQESPD